VSIAFLLTTLVIAVSPGTRVLYTLSAGLARGRRASIVAAFGCTLGIVPHIAAATLGLARFSTPARSLSRRSSTSACRT
jgi:threonine/homoserine/homoserine lactone efflux protein